MTGSASGSVSPGPNECRNTSQGEWRPERLFPLVPGSLREEPECDTEPLFNPVHPANPVLQLQLRLAMR